MRDRKRVAVAPGRTSQLSPSIPRTRKVTASFSLRAACCMQRAWEQPQIPWRTSCTSRSRIIHM